MTESNEELELKLMRELRLADSKGYLDLKKVERAYERAHKNRDFEIELYWKRATYFWGFEAAFLAVAGIVLTSGNLNGWSFGFLALIALAGFCVTVLWAMMSSGAKFWQNNWEHYIDLLEPYVVGDIYKNFLSNKDLERPFSVTKVNTLVIYVCGMLWTLTYLFAGYAATNSVEDCPKRLACSLVFYLIGFVLIAFSMIQLRGSCAWGGFQMGNPNDNIFTTPSFNGKKVKLYKRPTILDKPSPLSKENESS